ncbi:PQQ-binding-like beta-propeller repeat protein, partial [Myxococcota bacterium]|nr:PQQ-binding-like beta-propeller repeat protein [Myxococcota bacterium]
MKALSTPFFLTALVLGFVTGCGPAATPTGEASLTAGWPTTGGDAGGTRYSPLAQIHRGNVDDLEVAWMSHTGHLARQEIVQDPARKGTAFEATPVLFEDTLYLCTPLNQMIALDARTGGQRWVFDAEPKLDNTWTPKCRGVAVWLDPQRGVGPCKRRVLMGTVDARLIAVDADTGRACDDFGQRGEVDLLKGLGDVAPGEYSVTSPPVVVDDIVTVGALVADNRRVLPPGGVIRGFDVRTGALRWAFDPIAPGTPPLAPGDDGEPRYHRGTPNAWSLLSADPELGLIFVPMGAPSPDFYGGSRKGLDYYASSVVALAADTGRVVWHFQTVHHDLWDYDVASQPSLVELELESGRIPALVQPTKMGHVFVLDRRTGEPLFPVEERPVPQSDIPGEFTSPPPPRSPPHPLRLPPAPFPFPHGTLSGAPGNPFRCRREPYPLPQGTVSVAQGKHKRSPRGTFPWPGGGVWV